MKYNKNVKSVTHNVRNTVKCRSKILYNFKKIVNFPKNQQRNMMRISNKYLILCQNNLYGELSVSHINLNIRGQPF